MNPRLSRRWALHEIERDLADFDPRLDELFSLFTRLARGAKKPGAERIRTAPLRLLARLAPRPDRHQAGEDWSASPGLYF
jgi:hypothetical protein